VARVDLIASSPLIRARQTAQTAHEVFQNALHETWDELESAEYSSLITRLQTIEAATLLLVGHEPGLSQFAARILTGTPGGFELEFKKAGICALDVSLSTRAPHAALLWHVTPQILRALKD
jgi:phosphohistidine phosphatase